jgi:hypothetical protein
VRTMGVPAGGLRATADPIHVPLGAGDAVPDDVLDELERLVGGPLADSYRRFLRETNGAGPVEPAVLPNHGFVADQPFFGVARSDPHHDLVFARDWLTDRFGADLLPIGYVQGGILLLGLSGAIAGSVWHWDDDDPRDDAAYGPAEICDYLLRRCAGSFDEFRDRLIRPPAMLAERAEAWAATGQIRVVRDELAGAGLPGPLRAPWQPQPGKSRDPIVNLFELR